MNSLNPIIIAATKADYPAIQKMWMFYVYDMGRECGFNKGWECPTDPDFVADDISPYFESQTRKAYLVKVDDQLAGFVLLNQVATQPDPQWNLDEFFIHGKYQGKGLGWKVAYQIWKMHPGLWTLSVIPENKSALKFWETVIARYTAGTFKRNETRVTDKAESKIRIIFSFDTRQLSTQLMHPAEFIIRPTIPADIPSQVSLSYLKRRAYEKAQPQFWKYASGAEEIQKNWFNNLLTDDTYIMLTAVEMGKVVGFIIGKLIPAPEVYNPGGLTLLIDDFCVETESDWSLIGGKLVATIRVLGKSKDATQIIVVCGNHDEPKRDFLRSLGLSLASEWYVGNIENNQGKQND